MSDYDNGYDEGYRAGMQKMREVGQTRIEELEAEIKLLNEQMAAIEEHGNEMLNALPDCLMRLAPALMENDELKAKLVEIEAENKLLSEGATIAHLRGAMDAHANRADDIWKEFKDRWEGEKKFALREVVKYLRGGKDE